MKIKFGKEVLAMMTSRLIAGSFCAALLAVGLLGTGVASANPPPSPPGPGEPGYCGAHTSPLDCWANTGPTTPGEAAFISRVRSYDIPGMPTDSTRLLQIARGTCQMLVGGTTTQYVVEELAQNLGKSEAGTGQIMIIAMETACPGLSVGTDGVARPA